MALSALKTTLRLRRPDRLRAARLCSDLVSPPMLGAIGIGLAAGVGTAWLSALLWVLGLALLVVVVPMLYLTWLLRRGLIDDLHLPRRQDRLLPGLASLATSLLALLLALLLRAPALLLPCLAAQCLAQALMLVITLRWQISYHAAATATLIALVLLLHGVACWPVLLLLPLVGWARVTLRRHTWAQVAAGALLGAATLLAAWQLA